MKDALTILQGDAQTKLRELPEESVQCVVTSPPYWNLRDYGVDGQIGLEDTPQACCERLVEVFREVWRVLRKDGTLWLNLGDSYATTPCSTGTSYRRDRASCCPTGKRNTGLKPKDLVGFPWMVAFALQADGWYLRQDIIWQKPNPMPESCRDRCTKSHEYVFLLSKSRTYYYDAEAIREGVTGNAHTRGSGVNPKAKWKTPDGWDTSKGEGGHGSIHRAGRERGKPRSKQNESFSSSVNELVGSRNKRSVWSIGTQAYADAHFATFPEALPRTCILAGSKPGDTVLDPFGGSGTTGKVALELGRRAILIELNPDYIPLIEQRCQVTLGLGI